MAANRLKELFDRHLSKTATAAEKQELAALALEAGNQELVKTLVSSSWDQTGSEEDMPQSTSNQILEGILKGEQTEAPVINVQFESNDTKQYTGRRIVIGSWKRIAIAAIFLIIAGVSTLLLVHNPGKEIDKSSALADLPAPSKVKATITLANGQQIALDSVNTGVMTTQGNTQLLKESNGSIRYEDRQPGSVREVTYNTLVNPRGSKVVTIILADGTRVWLNSESTLRYFSGVGKGDRNVELIGEAYFDVVKDAKHPFKVNVEGVSTEVLGTQFNINRYKDESATRITLVDGSVKVSHGVAATILKPGQQARVATNIEVEKDVDVESVVAWKNGQFSFQDRTLSEVLKQMGRWYDIDIVYENKIPDITFFGEMESNVTLTQMLHFLEKSGVKFKLDAEKKKLIIR